MSKEGFLGKGINAVHNAVDTATHPFETTTQSKLRQWKNAEQKLETNRKGEMGIMNGDPTGLVAIGGLGLALFFLYESMNRKNRK